MNAFGGYGARNCDRWRREPENYEILGYQRPLSDCKRTAQRG